MPASSSCQSPTDGQKSDKHRIHDANAALIKAIQEIGGKDCFAAEISFLCPNVYCRWRDDCLRLSTV